MNWSRKESLIFFKAKENATAPHKTCTMADLTLVYCNTPVMYTNARKGIQYSNGAITNALLWSSSMPFGIVMRTYLGEVSRISEFLLGLVRLVAVKI